MEESTAIGRNLDGVIARICAARTVENPLAADYLATDLREYMRKFGPPDADARSRDDLRKDETLLASLIAIAPLGDPDNPGPQPGTLLGVLRDLALARKPCGKQYAWFRSVFAQRIHGTDPKALAKALDKARPRRKPQTPSPERGLPAASPNGQVNPNDELRETVREIAKSRSMP